MSVKPICSSGLRGGWLWHPSGLRNRPLEVVAGNDSLDYVIQSNGAIWSRSSYSLGHKKLIFIKLAVGVTLRQLFLHVQCVSEFETPGNSGVSSSEALFYVHNDKLCAKLRLVGD